MKEEVLQTLSRNKVRIILGDIDLGEKISESAMTATVGRVVAGTEAILIGLVFKLAEGVIEGKKTMSRLKFIKNTLFLAGGASVAPFASSVGGIGLFLAGMNVDRENAIQRIYWRLNGLLNHFAPEDHTIFFRNLVFADKLLNASEALSQELGRKTRIAFNVGLGHTGIEDLLLAGHDFTRLAITQYPNDFLKEVVETNGGIENFCGVRMLTLPPPPDFTVAENLDSPIEDKLVLDKPLSAMLKSKLQL